MNTSSFPSFPSVRNLLFLFLSLQLSTFNPPPSSAISPTSPSNPSTPASPSRPQTRSSSHPQASAQVHLAFFKPSAAHSQLPSMPATTPSACHSSAGANHSSFQ